VNKNDSKMLFIIGAGRSGTTFLADLISSHPDLHRLPELRYLWMTGCQWRDHDFRGVSDATPKVKQRIRSYISKIAPKNAKVIVEKTPSNCFRIGLINEVYPRAKYIHIVRDGRSTALSSLKAQYGAKAFNAKSRGEVGSAGQLKLFLVQRLNQIRQKLSNRAIPADGLLPMLVIRFGDVMRRVMTNKPAIWGAKFPGMAQLYHQLKVHQIVALQWRYSVDAALSGFRCHIKSENILTIEYGSLIRSPDKQLELIYDFVGVGALDNVEELSPLKVKMSDNDWSMELSIDERLEMESLMEPELSNLGY
jgi:hypothetical protein